MVVAKRQREKPTNNGTKESLRTRVRPRVKQTVLLAGPVCIGKAQGRRKTM